MSSSNSYHQNVLHHQEKNGRTNRKNNLRAFHSPFLQKAGGRRNFFGKVIYSLTPNKISLLRFCPRSILFSLWRRVCGRHSTLLAERKVRSYTGFHFTTVYAPCFFVSLKNFLMELFGNIMKDGSLSSTFFVDFFPLFPLFNQRRNRTNQRWRLLVVYYVVMSG